MTALIVLTSILAYLVCYVVVAGAWYREIRPYREPISCMYKNSRDYQYHSHDHHCHRRPGHYVDTHTEAMTGALGMGLLGPLGVLGMILIHFIKKTDRELAEEQKITIARLEKELGMK